MIISSIDIMGGKAVQLKQGSELVLTRDNPLDLAADFNRFGEIAVIDLDAALGKGENEGLIREICNIADCRVGGGLDLVRAKKMLTYGATKVIIGSNAFTDSSIAREFLAGFTSQICKDRVIIAIDSRAGRIVTKGWKHETGIPVESAITELEPFCSEFLFTCVEREGCLGGTDLELCNRLRNLTKNSLTVAGGVTTIDEARKISRFGADVQLGMALYTDRIKLPDAFAECLNWKEPLLPAITCDESGQVLMQAFMNKESLLRTFETGEVCYFSRSRNSLWHKGETSGNIQKFLKIRTDCDRDSLLITVRQSGAACHQNSYSCFGDRRFSLYELYDVVRDRFENPKQGSYTSSLTAEMICEKILEEAQEVVEAKKRDEIIWEAADVLYFVTALLAKKGVSIDDVLHELRRRRR
ncbi:MAG: bifunctional phosphoribosyl-AMP cyclohydrolase/phosphoribosyl-ATP diphosphatase HisIE [Candidatus Wallbacteria bacterium]|nr:bifunctional phosphoribosyl-AMP cyclohydrolase/phosphoribosyl-ATP diphosphatase HisIE [Candidatus Wallbacteria bacterium]